MNEERKYGDEVRITRDMILADDFCYYVDKFFGVLKQSRIAGEQLLESIEAERRLKQKVEDYFGEGVKE